MNTPFSMPIEAPSRSGKQGELILGLYDINQQRLIDNGGSVFIGDRVFIEIKYRTGSNIIIKFSYFSIVGCFFFRC